MTQLDKFIAQVKVGGMARTNRYSVILSPPASLQNVGGTDVTQRILLFCEQVQVPGLNISTIQNRTFGEFREVPYEKLFGEINLSFYVDTNMTVKRLFDEWMGLIQNPYTRTFNYYKNYITDMIINIEDVEDKKRYEVKLFECYPKSIAPIQMDYTNKDVMKLQVTLQYKYWRSSTVQVAQQVGNPSIEGRNFEVPEAYYNDFTNFQTQYNETGYDSLVDRTVQST